MREMVRSVEFTRPSARLNWIFELTEGRGYKDWGSLMQIVSACYGGPARFQRYRNPLRPNGQCLYIGSGYVGCNTAKLLMCNNLSLKRGTNEGHPAEVFA